MNKTTFLYKKNLLAKTFTHYNALMIILGIDPGSASTGWGVIHVNGNTYSLIDFGVIGPKSKKLSERYFFIFDELEALIKKFNPDAISIETQFVYLNAQSALKIGMAKGVGLILAGKYNIPIFEYAPKTAKRAVTGSGSASKESVEKMIYLLLHIAKAKKIPNDASDALALAICHAHNRKSHKAVEV